MCTFLSWWPAEPEEEGDVEEKNNKALPSEIPQSPQDTTPHSTTPPPQFIHWGRRTRFHYGLRCVQKGARHSSASPYLPPSLSLSIFATVLFASPLHVHVSGCRYCCNELHCTLGRSAAAAAAAPFQLIPRHLHSIDDWSKLCSLGWKKKKKWKNNQLWANVTPPTNERDRISCANGRRQRRAAAAKAGE